MDGILLFDKPIGETSRSSANKLARLFNEKKIGYVGTLDPFASGLLIMAFGKSTKAVTFFKDSIKEYEATLKLGEATSTLDNESEVIETKSVKELSEEQISKVLLSFLGESEQIPPLTSAIHVNGKRLYEYAHKGIEIDRPTRKINVFDIKLLEYNKNNSTIRFYCKVSKGTYIRSLGSDIANKLDTVGHLIQLRRISVDCFKVDEAYSLTDLANNNYKIYSTYEILSRFIEVVTLKDNDIEDIKNGKRTYLDFSTNKNTILVSDSNKTAIAIYQKENNKFKFVRGLF